MSKNNKNLVSFFEDVYEVVGLIPWGRVSTYGAIARYLGSAQSARVVGWALNQCHKRGNIPAHRVVNRNGMLSGQLHFETPTAMQEKLQQEGIQVQDHTVLDFKKRFWDPAKALE